MILTLVITCFVTVLVYEGADVSFWEAFVTDQVWVTCYLG
jgi:Cu2+-containing amine oxidase